MNETTTKEVTTAEAGRVDPVVRCPDGTYDNTKTGTRQVVWNGVLGFELRKDIFHLVRDTNSNPVEFLPWGTFPDHPQNLADI